MLCVRDGGDAREPRSCQHETPPPHPAGQSLVLQLPRAASWQQGGPPQLSLTSLSSPSTGWGTTRTLQLFGNGTGGGGAPAGSTEGAVGRGRHCRTAGGQLGCPTLSPSCPEGGGSWGGQGEVMSRLGSSLPYWGLEG